MPSTLLLLQCHLKRPEQGRLMATSIALARRLNPDVDVLLIDNGSYLAPEIWLPEWSRVDLAPEGAPVAIPSPRAIAGFAEAIGHFHYDRHNAVPPKDGPGRAIMTGLRIAAASGYERAAYMESDALIAKPLTWCWEQMTKPTAAQPRIRYGYLDWQCWAIADLQWLVNTYDFPGKYDWPNRKPDWMGEKCGELIYEDILGEHLEVLPWRSGRGDEKQIVDGTMAARFEEVADSITHVCPADFATWLEMNGHGDLVAGLMSGITSRAAD